MPRLLIKMPGRISHAWRGPGAILLSNPHQKKSCNGQRDVAEGLDIDLRQFAHEPVAGQPRQPHQGAEDRRKNDTKHGDMERVGQPDEECAGIGVCRRIVDQLLADAERGLPAEKPEPVAMLLATQY